jgi:hypothetical protein
MLKTAKHLKTKAVLLGNSSFIPTDVSIEFFA